MTQSDQSESKMVDFYVRGLAGDKYVTSDGWEMDSLLGHIKSLNDTGVSRNGLNVYNL